MQMKSESDKKEKELFEENKAANLRMQSTHEELSVNFEHLRGESQSLKAERDKLLQDIENMSQCEATIQKFESAANEHASALDADRDETPMRIETRKSYEIEHKLATELFRFHCKACSYFTNTKSHFQSHLASERHRTNSIKAEARNGAVVAAEAGLHADSSDHDDTLGKRTRCRDSAAPSGSLELKFTVYK